jgi:hypothetical protein
MLHDGPLVGAQSGQQERGAHLGVPRFHEAHITNHVTVKSPETEQHKERRNLPRANDEDRIVRLEPFCKEHERSKAPETEQQTA